MPHSDFNILCRDLESSQGTSRAYGQSLGDVGSVHTFLDFKAGDFRRINPQVWEVLYPHSPIANELHGVTLDFLKPY